jgi:hypothetical protein
MTETLYIGEEKIDFIQAPELTGNETWLDDPWDGLTWAELGERHPCAKIIVTLRGLPYHEYLRTMHWRGVRTRAWRRYRGQCVCGKDASDAHHMSYARKGFERPRDVIAVCRECHKTWHDTWILQAKESLK